MAIANPLDHFGGFLSAVYDHLFTLLAGCVVTVVLNYIEKHTPLKGKITWKTDLAIVLLFVFFACFQAWHDEYTKAEKLQSQLDAKPAAQPTFQVNVPPIAIPPATIITQNNSDNYEPGYLQLGPIGPADNVQKLTAGKPLLISVYWLNKSSRPVENIKNLIVLDVASPSNEKTTRQTFSDYVKRSDKAFGKKKAQSTLAPSEPPLFNTAESRVLSQPDIDNIMLGKLRIYLEIWISWQDLRGKRGKIEDCWFLIPPTNPPLTFTLQNTNMHTCSDETRIP